MSHKEYDTKILNNLAPIGVSTYARLPHLKKTISALQQNTLAQQSELFVFSDASRHGDEERVIDVRNYLQSVEGFKDVHIIKRENNDRIVNNRSGINMLLNRFGKVIFLEEDIITAPGFLNFMNQALEKYAENDQIFSVVGYSPPIKIPKNYQHDIFILRRCSAWGFGIWKNRFDQIKYISPDEYEQFAVNKKRVREFVKGGGKDLMTMLRADSYGKIDAGDVKAMYAQFLSNQYTVYPTQSLVQNIGHDGTGIHCGKSDKFKVTLSNKNNFLFLDKPILDPRIVKANRIFRDGTLYDQFLDRIIYRLFRLIKRQFNKIISFK
ncbi:MAG: glycosyltransferase [Candidatus Electrothrix sp. MAN1_4]|nr:glycosyltransferase [Candidatus Electrothrix sp. MAN1_4]